MRAAALWPSGNIVQKISLGAVDKIVSIVRRKIRPVAIVERGKFADGNSVKSRSRVRHQRAAAECRCAPTD